ncbi:hypothetical protein TL16_g00227 [Triparma laevis f. inornata]|uniref:EF-hand domain-containing protein n=1 Tax=Triparma laevis f. inornata TaxID=1714386 RepID=A0A9W7DN09_9STRA|nr:hypothetical protein TL16_g00227 [Triparma laevis f. inornata]
MENLNPVQKRIVVALQATKQKPQNQDMNFTKILLKFSKIRATINNVKEIFANVDDDNDGLIDETQIQTCLNKLKSEIQISELHDFFVVSAVSKGEKADANKLNQKEFLVALSICYVLRTIPAFSTPAGRRSSIDRTTPAEAKVRSNIQSTPKQRPRKNSVTGLFSTNDKLKDSFDLMVHAYLLFDQDAKGYINKSDLGSVMKEDGAGEGQFFLDEERWNEMDWNHDGTIEFSEFIYTFSRWVDIDED